MEMYGNCTEKTIAFQYDTAPTAQQMTVPTQPVTNLVTVTSVASCITNLRVKTFPIFGQLVKNVIHCPYNINNYPFSSSYERNSRLHVCVLLFYVKEIGLTKLEQSLIINFETYNTIPSNAVVTCSVPSKALGEKPARTVQCQVHKNANK